MNIAATQFNLENNSLEIYVSGCTLNCPGCHNPELQDFLIGEPYEKVLPKIKEKIEDFDDIIHNIWILGGEPLNQNMDELKQLIDGCKFTKKEMHCGSEFTCCNNKVIWIFTGYPFKYAINKIQEMKNLEHINYIKFGRYDETKKCEKIVHGITLASENQGIFKM
jgi:anaerobic ribonucleoside-triphosphate reductase activating protein